MSKEVTKIKVTDYGDMLATVNDLELVSYEEAGDYQGEYLAVLKDKNRLFYYSGSFGSCSGCDWLEDERDYTDGTVEYKKAVEYCGDIKPMYIVPLDRPLQFKNENYYGWKLV